MMSTDSIDTAKLANDLSLHAIERVLTASNSVFLRYWQRHKARDAATYTEYLKSRGAEVISVRNLLYDTRSTSLYDIYIPTTLTAQDRYNSKDYSGDAFLRLACTDQPKDPQKRPTLASVVLGVAGSGKSLFMRHAFFALQNLPPYRIPILLEMRSFNRETLGDLQQRITDEISSTGVDISREQVLAALQSGLFFILLDGMDELHAGYALGLPAKQSRNDMRGIQEHYETELLAFVKKYPLCPIIVSSRPMNRVYSWGQFETRSIAPLRMPDAVKLVGKLEFDRVVKQRFQKLLRTRLFDTHNELVSVPLLCIIMLLTYSETGYIANHRHEFYEDAFNALWSKHDGRKDGGFVREKQTRLQKSEFLRLLSGFAMSSYNSGDYDMKESQVDKHFDSAAKLSGIKCGQDKFIFDFTTSTSLGIYDGPYLRFCHRSFHEYFAATFLAHVDDKYAEKIIDEISGRLETDNVMPLLLSIAPEKIEKTWVAPRLLEIEQELRKHGFGVYNAYFSSRGRKYKKLYSYMSQIRALYRFATKDKIEAAIDANLHMGMGEQSFDEAPVTYRLFDADYNSFTRLAEEMRGKYAQKSSALEEMIKNS